MNSLDFLASLLYLVIVPPRGEAPEWAGSGKGGRGRFVPHKYTKTGMFLAGFIRFDRRDDMTIIVFYGVAFCWLIIES